MNRALFLDRDGVINRDHGYVSRVEDFEFIEGIFDTARAARDAGYLLIVVTNQAGIARGYYTESQFMQLSEWMRKRFAEQGATIAGVYFCPHHPEHGIGAYLRDCPCRKPNPGMLLRAAEDHDLDLGRSILVGDMNTDILAGQRAGVGINILFGSEEQKSPLDQPPTLCAPDHAVLADWLGARRAAD